MPEWSGEPNRLLVMVLMVMGVPPCSLVRPPRDGHACYSYLAGIARSESLGPPLGLLHSSVEILGEGGEEGIGQCDHFVMV